MPQGPEDMAREQIDRMPRRPVGMCSECDWRSYHDKGPTLIPCEAHFEQTCASETGNVKSKDLTLMVPHAIESYAIEAAYGRAVLAAHSLETTLYTLLFTHFSEVNGSNKVALQQEKEKLSRMTLGNLIDRVISEFQISEYWQEELDNMLYFRNRLVHQIAIDISSSFLRHGTKQNIVEELERIRSYFVETNQEMERIMFDRLNAKGITKEKLEQAVKKIIANAEKNRKVS